MPKYSARRPRRPASASILEYVGLYGLSRPAAIRREECSNSEPQYGILGIEGKLSASGIFEANPFLALLAVHDARMSVAC